MPENRLFTVNEFADYSRTTKDTLIHYDKIGLLTPALRGENNYRYYSGGQLAVVNVIRIFARTRIVAQRDKRQKRYYDTLVCKRGFGTAK